MAEKCAGDSHDLHGELVVVLVLAQSDFSSTSNLAEAAGEAGCDFAHNLQQRRQPSPLYERLYLSMALSLLLGTAEGSNESNWQSWQKLRMTAYQKMKLFPAADWFLSNRKLISKKGTDAQAYLNHYRCSLFCQPHVLLQDHVARAVLAPTLRAQIS